jgi:hypothetical protein
MTLNPDDDHGPPGRDDIGPLPDPELCGPDPEDMSSCPPDMAGFSARELAAAADAAAAAKGSEPPDLWGAGFYRRSRCAGADAGLGGSPVIGAGFAQGGALDTMEPGPGLAGFADEAHERGAGLADLSDDELIGVMEAWQREEARAVSRGLQAVLELARRRPLPGRQPVPAGQVPEAFGEFTADEIAASLRISVRAADARLGLAFDLRERLPATAVALHAGVITGEKMERIARRTAILSGEHAREADARLYPKARDQTPDALGKALDKIIDEIDPDAARRRKEAAQQAARIRHWREDAGTAALAGYGLPPADVLAANQHIDLTARALRAIGVDGTLDQLRALVFIDLLLERDPAARADGSEHDADGTGPGSSAGDTGNDTHDADHDDAGDDADHDDAGDGADDDDADGEGGNDGKGPGGPGSGGRGPAGGRTPAPAPLASMATLIIPLRSLLGIAGVPGEAAGFGPVDPATLRDLAAAASAHPQTRWCVTVTDDDGYAVGHGCAPGRHDILRHAGLTDDTGPPGTGPPGTRPGGRNRDGPPGGRDHPPGGNRDDPPGPAGPAIGEILRKLGVTIEPIARGTCDHRHEEPGYTPSRKLRHLVAARTATCTSPGCGQTWARSDADHTVPYDGGGRTCECGLGPACRHDHRKKQSRGWSLQQPEPGTMIWRTPAGRLYVTGPTQYPS